MSTNQRPPPSIVPDLTRIRQYLFSDLIFYKMIDQKETTIIKNCDYVTEINFFHVDENNQGAAAEIIKTTATGLVGKEGFISVNVLTSTDDTRICTYVQWQSETGLAKAKKNIKDLHNDDFKEMLENQSGIPRLYEVYYTDDQSEQGVSVISPSYKGTVFINEITTSPGNKQYRLLELVINNNVKQSLSTPGYRSANFHRSFDGYRAVNYSLWDSEDHLIQAISEMADQDINLEETMELASPDFRFYKLYYFNHI